MRISLIALTALLLASCGPDKPEVQIVPQPFNVYPKVSAELLACPAEPKVPDGVKTDVELIKFLESVRIAGAKCRETLGKVADYVHSWPQQ